MFERQTWVVDTELGEHGDTSILLHEDGEAFVIATVHGTFDGGDAAPATETANLIAAAPDLHEAVSRAARMFRHYETLHRAKGTKDGDDKAASNAGIAEFCEAALAKANGLQKEERS